MKASLYNYRQSPRKVRLVATFLKGKEISVAEAELSFLTKRASLPIRKLLDSAVANAKANFNIDKENLIIENVIVDKGIVMKRSMPRARGSASRINKRTSHVTVTLKEKGTDTKAKSVTKTKKAVKTEKVVTKTVKKESAPKKKASVSKK